MNKQVEEIFNSLTLVGIAWVVFGTALLLTRGNKKEDQKDKGDKRKKISLRDSLVIGTFQAIALLPGVSRSGSTIIGGLWQKFSMKKAFELSFLLAIPAIFGASFLSFLDRGTDGVNVLTGILAAAVAGLVGYHSLKALKKIIISEKFYLFGYYCLAMGIFTILFLR